MGDGENDGDNEHVNVIKCSACDDEITLLMLSACEDEHGPIASMTPSVLAQKRKEQPIVEVECPECEVMCRYVCPLPG